MKEKIGNGEASGYMPAAVYAVIGEPAIVINGVPNVSSVTSGRTHFDAQRDMESEIDPLFGGWLVGRKVRKLFGNQYYSGNVVKYDAEFNWYRVVYEDGDSEDLEWHELEEVLVPLDISVPLTTLALQRSRSYDTSVSWSDEKTSKSKRSLGFQKTLHFLQEPQPCELKGKDIVELNVMDENTQERTIKSKRRSDTKRTSLNMNRHENPISVTEECTIKYQNYETHSTGNTLPLIKYPCPTECDGEKLGLGDVSKENTTQDSLKKQKEVYFQSPRDEKQKQENLSDQDQLTASRLKEELS